MKSCCKNAVGIDVACCVVEMCVKLEAVFDPTN